MSKSNGNNNRLTRIAAGITAVGIIVGSVCNLLNIRNKNKRNEGKGSSVGYYDSNLPDVFDEKHIKDINGQYFVLKLREAFNADCSTDAKKTESHGHSSSMQEHSLYFIDDENNRTPIKDGSEIPEYMLLVGSYLTAYGHIPSRNYEYEFFDYQQDPTTYVDSKTDISLVREGKDNFSLRIWHCPEKINGILYLDDSYIFPVSSLTDVETQKLLEQYNNDSKVASIVTECRNKDFLDRDFEVSLNEEYYVLDIDRAWEERTKEVKGGNKICAFYDIDKDGHECLLNDEYNGFECNTHGGVPKYILLKAGDKNSIQEGDGSFTTCFQNYEILPGGINTDGIKVVRNSKGDFTIYLNNITVPINDKTRAYFNKKIEGIELTERINGITLADLTEKLEKAECIVIHGCLQTISSHVRPLSSLSKEEIEVLASHYRYDEEIVSIIKNAWFSPLIVDEQIEELVEEPVMSNGFTASENAKILSIADEACIASQILNQNNIGGKPKTRILSRLSRK